MTATKLQSRLGAYCTRHHLERYEQEGLLIRSQDGYTDESSLELITKVEKANSEMETIMNDTNLMQIYVIFIRSADSPEQQEFVTVSGDNGITDVNDPRVAKMDCLSAQHKVSELRDNLGLDAGWSIYRPAWLKATGQVAS